MVILKCTPFKYKFTHEFPYFTLQQSLPSLVLLKLILSEDMLNHQPKTDLFRNYLLFKKLLMGI